MGLAKSKNKKIKGKRLDKSKFLLKILRAGLQVTGGIKMKVKCIEDKYSSQRFTINKIYYIKDNVFYTDYIPIAIQVPLAIEDGKFEFQYCEFEIIK